jgi:hypothetical protein
VLKNTQTPSRFVWLNRSGFGFHVPVFALALAATQAFFLKESVHHE